METYNFEKLNQIYQEIDNLKRRRQSSTEGLSYEEELKYVELQLYFLSFENEPSIYKDISNSEDKNIEIEYLTKRLNLLKSHNKIDKAFLAESTDLFYNYPFSYAKHSLQQDCMSLRKNGITDGDIFKLETACGFEMFNYWDILLNISNLKEKNVLKREVNMRNITYSYNTLREMYNSRTGPFNDKPRHIAR